MVYVHNHSTIHISQMGLEEHQIIKAILQKRLRLPIHTII